MYATSCVGQERRGSVSELGWTQQWEGWAGKKRDGEGGGNNLGYVCVLSIPSSPG